MKHRLLSQPDFNQIFENRVHNGDYFIEKRIGSTKILSNGQKDVAHLKTNDIYFGDNLTPKDFGVFIAQFNKHLYRNFFKNQSLYNLKVNFKGPTKHVKKDFYKKLNIGNYFYEIDITSAYWQILHKLGYISTSFFKIYRHLDEYKQAKRLCVSFLARQRKATYFFKDNPFEINCDNSVLKTVYENVQNELRRIIHEAVNAVNSEYYYYTIDSICVMNVNVDKAKAIFKKHGLSYKITECQKIDEKTFKHGKKIRKAN
jgi:hypothetical protein